MLQHLVYFVTTAALYGFKVQPQPLNDMHGVNRQRTCSKCQRVSVYVCHEIADITCHVGLLLLLQGHCC